MAERARRGSGRARSPRHRGRIVASLLAGSWAADPLPAANLDGDALDRVLPFLLASGSGALAWSRIRTDPDLAASSAGLAIHDAFRHAVLEAAVRERRIVELVSRLRSAGIEPMLFKGRAAATAYGQPSLRPGGDVDLLVPPEGQQRAAALLHRETHLRSVDLDHEHLVPGAERPGLFSRAGELLLDGVAVTVPSPEDHLRLLCLHALSHGVARPHWLCDVAAWVEARPPGFDWSMAMTTDPYVAERLMVALGLAHRLLGMRIEGTPVEGRRTSPGWAASAVLRTWSDPRNAVPMQAWHTHGSLRGRTSALARRWPPDPIVEAVDHGRPFSAWPRLPFQVADALRRAVRARSPS